MATATSIVLPWVYPRVCGGTMAQVPSGSLVNGLSPRVRGNPLRRLDDGEDERSIPACAGEPMPSDTVYSRTTVYPRVCGGTKGKSMMSALGRGLSPRVRGNHGPSAIRQLGERSIPACAGEPTQASRRRRRRTVYPRVCGGTSIAKGVKGLVEGLSPRVRGNLVKLPLFTLYPGSIPACAGEPLYLLPPPGHPVVYPRVCGGTAPGAYPAR